MTNPKYSHFARIPTRIIRYLDHFGLTFHRDATYRKLLAHYMFIAVVDDAIDSGHPCASDTVFEIFSDIPSRQNESWRTSDIAVVTEILKHHIATDAHAPMLNLLQLAYQEVVNERAAMSVDAYIQHRKDLGRLTAQQSCLLISAPFDQNHEHISRLMQDIGAVGCLIDSAIDIPQDSRDGLLNFTPTAFDYTKLCCNTLIAALRVWVRKPSLTLLLTEAILDNIRDRSRARASSSEIRTEGLSTALIPSAETGTNPKSRRFNNGAY